MYGPARVGFQLGFSPVSGSSLDTGLLDPDIQPFLSRLPQSPVLRTPHLSADFHYKYCVALD